MLIGIAGVTSNMAIGKGCELIVRNPADLAFFSGLTQGKTLVMGRKTHETISDLYNRSRVVLSRDGILDVNDVLYYAKNEDIVVAGGGEIYSLFSGYYDEFFLTRHVTQTEPTGDDVVYLEHDVLKGMRMNGIALKQKTFTVEHYVRACVNS